MKPDKTENKDHEKELEQVEQQYRSLPQDEPPDMVDQAVLNKARLAAETRSIRPWNFGWMHATATAALVVIGLTLVLQQRGNLPAPPEALERKVLALPEYSRSYAEGFALDELRKADDAAEEMTAVSELEETGFRAPDSRPAAAPAAPPPVAEAEKSEYLAVRNEPGPAPRKETRQAIGQEAAQKRVEQERQRAGEEPEGYRRDLPDAKPDVPVPLAETVSDSARQESGAGFATLGGARIGQSSEAAREPDEWIAAILEMRESGADDLAWQAELEAFAQAYPDHELPAELAKALEEIRARKTGGR